MTVGTVFERSKVPLTKWWMAAHMMNSGKNGVSAHEIHRALGVTYKTAWFMMRRLREAMTHLAPAPMGDNGGNVQSDETYDLNTSKRAKGYKNKASILAPVDEETGYARAFHVKGMSLPKVREIIFSNVRRKATLVTDEAPMYQTIGWEFEGGHQKVKHTGREYVNKAGFTTNNVESFFGVFKRGMRGTYTFCGEQHLQRYLAEFQFRYNTRTALGVNDGERTALAMKGIEGKRLTYRSAH